MQKRVAFVFTNMPYGSSSSQEGLYASLATCVLTDQVGVFFVFDGVFLLLSDQNPNIMYGKNFIASFEMLLLCGIDNIYLCSESAFERGLTQQMRWVSKEIIWLSIKYWRKQLLSYDMALRF